MKLKVVLSAVTAICLGVSAAIAAGEPQVVRQEEMKKVGGAMGALGAIAKGGQQTVRGVLAATERPRGSGLFLMDTPYFSPESITAMVAAGAQIVVFTTGPGNSYASLVAPTIKMSANPAATARLTEQIDFVATAALDRSTPLETLAADGFAHLVDVASGTLTFGEIVGEGGEVVSRLGPSI